MIYILYFLSVLFSAGVMSWVVVGSVLSRCFVLTEVKELNVII